MQPIHITVGAKRALLVIPDSQAHLDGHTILTYSYNIYREKSGMDAKEITRKEAALHLEKKNDPDYLGEIIFELPGRIFNYVDDGPQRLSTDEVEEAIEQISEYRDDSSRWKL